MAFKIYLYDTDTDCIGSGSLCSAYIQYQLEAAAGQDVEIHISSVGGSAFDAIAIYDLLKKYNGVVVTYIDALAASAASIVAMGGSKIVMSKYALLMIHKPMVGSGGNADELMKDVQMLNVVQSRLAQIYIDKTGLDEVTVNSLINSVTWMTADQALDLGFIDEIDDYDVAITNTSLIKKYTQEAPPVYQRVINKILNKQTQISTDMNAENKEFIEKTTSVLDKIMNFFKKVVNQQTVTNKGTLHHMGALAEGVEVFNSDVMDKAPEDDDDMEATDASGKKVKIKIKDGKVENIAGEDDDDEDADPDKDKEDEEADPENKVVLNSVNIDTKALGLKKEVSNSIAIKIKDLKNKLEAQNALLVEATDALKAANERLELTREEVKNEISSDFTPEGSKRSSKAKAEAPIPSFLTPAPGSLAANALAKSKANRS